MFFPQGLQWKQNFVAFCAFPVATVLLIYLYLCCNNNLLYFLYMTAKQTCPPIKICLR